MVVIARVSFLTVESFTAVYENKLCIRWYGSTTGSPLKPDSPLSVKYLRKEKENNDTESIELRVDGIQPSASSEASYKKIHKHNSDAKWGELG